ncbi:hypothetical protein BdWA1_002111 [Babesia duncani]|uniref:Uncharacterized protein n=1 Tax=Babesia duncani TaxID=323732 RepID=A0AAD9PLZ2_9APIC|nr:hypothetical protein BdWA1_002111 [Babesia duncani]
MLQAYNEAIEATNTKRSDEIEIEILENDATNCHDAINIIKELMLDKPKGLKHAYKYIDEHFITSRIITLANSAEDIVNKYLRDAINAENLQRVDVITKTMGQEFEKALALLNGYSNSLLNKFEQEGVKVDKRFKRNLTDELRLVAYRPNSKAIPESIITSDLWIKKEISYALIHHLGLVYLVVPLVLVSLF